MAEKKKWAPTKMFLQWCLSYLLISVIALTLLLASGYRYLDVLRDNLEYTNGIQLDMTRVWLDQKVKLLRNITAKESSTAAIEAVRQTDDYDDIPRYDYYMLTRKISTDVINYGIGDAYFLYFPSTDAIVSNTKYGQSRRFYDLVLEAYDISYEDWMEILKQNLVTTRVFQPVVQGKDSKNYLVLMRPLNITSREPDKAVAVMIVDLEDLFKTSDWLNNDTLCINDRNNGVLVANHELPEATENAVTELIKSSGSRKFDEAAHRTSKEEYISIISSTYENWDIAVILKEQAFASKIIDIQKLLAVVVIIYLLLTVAVIANSAAKRYLKLRNIVQVLHRGNAADPEENLTDAFAYIDSRVQKWLTVPIKTVEASCSTKRHKGVIETEDTCDVFMTGPNGERLVFFCTNCYVKNAPVELEIVCENGSIRMVGNLVTTELDGKTETKDFSSGTVFGKDYWGSGHGFLIEDYYTRLAAGERFPVSGEEAIVSTRLLHAVYSSAKNHEVIRLDTKENQA